MNYAWEAVLQAEKEKRERDRLRFTQADVPSPYIEVSVTDLNIQCPEEDVIEVNPLYRFAHVFGKIFDKNIKGMEQTRALFFDVCMHYIVQLDLREGISKEYYYAKHIYEDIERGMYGEKWKKKFKLFHDWEQNILVYAYLKLLKTGDERGEFRKTVTTLYPNAHLYENNETGWELLVYLGVKDTKEERERAMFLREMFLSIKEQVHYFYEHHFGILDVEETMVMDEMVLF